MLDVVLALDGVADIVKLLEVNQPLQPVPFGKAINESGTMFEYPTYKIACHSDIENAVWTIGENVNVSTGHVDILQDVDGRDKPGHDEPRDFH
jgi:hypothetical protein